MKNLFGIMQGRLLPKYQNNFQAHPFGYWEKEFNLAEKLGFDCIEFILDFHLAEMNPLLNTSGIHSILLHSKKNNIQIKSICADYFMVSPIFINETSIKKTNKKILLKLINNSKILGVKDIVIPLVDNSSILNNEEKQKQTSKFLREILDEFKNIDINICLETDLPPKQFLNLLKSINKPQIKVNYDTGNSASLGYNFEEEFGLYGNLVTNIHIKDRKFNKGSVPLGTGDCNFKNFFKYLSSNNYDGIFILQAYRDNDALLSLKPQYEYIKNCISNYYHN